MVAGAGTGASEEVVGTEGVEGEGTERSRGFDWAAIDEDVEGIELNGMLVTE